MRNNGFKEGSKFDILKTVPPLHQQLRVRRRRLDANIVRATWVGQSICVGVDSAACAMSIIVDPVDFVFAIRVLVDRDTVSSCKKNLKDKGIYVYEYLRTNMYRLWMSGGLKIRDSYYRIWLRTLDPQCTGCHWRALCQHWRQWGRWREQNK